MEELLGQTLSAVIQKNREIQARLNMAERMIAVLLVQQAADKPDPQAFAMNAIERMRHALHVSDDESRRGEWEEMEAGLDNISNVVLLLTEPEMPNPPGSDKSTDS